MDVKDKLKKADEHAGQPGTQLVTVNQLMAQTRIRSRFEEILGQKAAGYISSVINTVNSSPHLKTAEPNSVMMAAVVAATLDLPIDKNLGFAYIVPYSGKAQFQLGYRGYIQLAMRTGQYKTINATEIYDGELVKHDRLTGEIEFDENQRASDKVIGYAAYFKLTNGFEKCIYWTIEKIKAHGKRYSKSFESPDGRWKLDFDAMALKTVLKMLLSKYGILSIEMIGAIKADQAVIKSENLDDVEYVDGVELLQEGSE